MPRARVFIVSVHINIDFGSTVKFVTLCAFSSSARENLYMGVQTYFGRRIQCNKIIKKIVSINFDWKFLVVSNCALTSEFMKALLLVQYNSTVFLKSTNVYFISAAHRRCKIIIESILEISNGNFCNSSKKYLIFTFPHTKYWFRPTLECSLY